MSTVRAPVAAQPQAPPARRQDRRREENLWQRGTAALALTALVLWLIVDQLTGGVRPGDPLGLAFGIAATALLVAALLYVARRRMMPQASKRRLGLARSWLLAHVYGSFLFLLAMLLHSGLRFPDGLVSWTLWGLSLWTVASGLAGLLAQRTVPRLLTSSASIEAHYDRIPELVDDIRRRCDELAAACEPPLRLLYSRRMAPVLASPARYKTALQGAGGTGRHLETLDHLRALIGTEERQRLDELERLYTAKLDLDTHYTLQHLLRTWLWLHVPPAILLAVVVLVHIATVLYY